MNVDAVDYEARFPYFRISTSVIVHTEYAHSRPSLAL